MEPQISHSAAIKPGDICIYMSSANRAPLNAIIADRNSIAKYMWRPRSCWRRPTANGTKVNAKTAGEAP
jgi:hypothetical protein